MLEQILTMLPHRPPFQTVSLLLVALCCSLVTVAASQQIGCPSTCGNLTIPYPFGVRTGCARSAGFTLTCDDSFNPPKTRFNASSVEVVGISLVEALVRVKFNRSYDCYLRNGSRDGYLPIRASAGNDYPFTFSSDHNKFTVLGCDTYAYLAESSFDTFASGCLSICNNLKYVTNASCFGIGCCQTAIPKGLRSYKIDISTYYNHTKVSDFNPCSYAFLVAQDWFTFNVADITKDSIYRSKIDKVPVVLDWVAGNPSCEVARRDNDSFACRSKNSICYNSTGSGTGYLCNCSSGYEGNPYLPGGCQDIDECSRPDLYPCKGTCENYPGNYSCYCPRGRQGDPRYYCSKEKKRVKVIIGISVGISCGLGAMLLAIGVPMIKNKLNRRRINQIRQIQYRENYDILLQRQVFYGKKDLSVDRIKFFTLSDMEKATNNFDKSKIVGSGGYGTVYKGLLDLEVVAVKKCNSDSRIEREQFINEVILLSHITHKNVVKLLGCCFETEVPLLVYEFISNGTLFANLHNPNEHHRLSWKDRVRIATEISSALAYMHSETYISIFHRDIKSENILLDDRLTAKISDFGTSRSVAANKTHASTRVMGTFGYMDPQYFQTGLLTDKSDVYSLGVILVEMLTSETPIPTIKNEDDRNLVIRFIAAVKENNLLQVVDASIVEEAKQEELEIVAKLAMASLNIRGEERPSIKDIEITLVNLVNKKVRGKQNPSGSGNLLQMEGVLHEMSSFHATCESATTSGSTKSSHGRVIELGNIPR